MIILKHIIFRLKYPKLILLTLTFVLAYFIVQGNQFTSVHEFISGLGYFGAFISGILFAYGFTAAPATAVFLILGKTQNIFLFSVIGGFGAFLGDTIIFKLVKFSLLDEILKLEKEKIFRNHWLHFSKHTKKYFIMIFAGFIYASPFPDEIADSILASSKDISFRVFAIISFVMNTVGIFIILWLGNVL